MSGFNAALGSLLEEYQQAAGLAPGQLMVIGCSSSEVVGQRIGTGSSLDAAAEIMEAITGFAAKYGIFVAIQCCEHLNRSLVVERECMEKYGLDQVSVIPYAKAGGAVAQRAMERFRDPVVVETLRNLAHGGMDIGDTFIGMHLRRVAVPVRLSSSSLGGAHVTAAKTRPPLVGGPRAKYE